MIPLTGVIAGAYGMEVPPTSFADNKDKIVAILPSARSIGWLRTSTTDLSTVAAGSLG